MNPSVESMSSELSFPERRRRIGELLCRAMLLADAERALAPAVASPESGRDYDTPVAASVRDSDDERILHFLRIAGEGTPATIRQSLGLSKTGAYRAFVRLLTTGRILTVGHTRSLVYHLKADEPPPDKIGLN